jgi:capsular polysaccharide biosynthesis protein
MDSIDADRAGRQSVGTLTDLLRVPIRRWRLVVSVAALVTLAALGYLMVAPPTYTGTAVVTVRPVVTDPFTYPSGGADRVLNMNAENGIATSSAVVAAVAAATHQSVVDAGKYLRVEVPVGGQVLRFNYLSHRADEAVRGTNAAAEAYLRVRKNLYEGQRAAIVRSYESAIDATTEQRNTAQKALPSTPNASVTTPVAAAALDQVRTLNEQLATLAQQRARVAAVDVTPGDVTNAASLPVPSTSDRAGLTLIAAMLGGLLVGAVAAFGREATDARVRSAAQAQEVTGLPLLGTVRHKRRRGSGVADADVRYVALAVAERAERTPGEPVVLLSARGGEGRTTLLSGLAVALATSGHDVYVGSDQASVGQLQGLLTVWRRLLPPPGWPVGADELPPPAQAKPTQMAPTQTMPTQRTRSTVSDLTAELPAATQDELRTSILTQESGALIGNAAQQNEVRIGAGRIRLGGLDTYPHDALVLIDGPDAEVDERGVRAARSGSALLVVARDRTRVTDLARLTERVRAAGVAPLGIVLTRCGRG